MPSMNRNSPYYAQVQLLIRLLPMVAAETCFALKGGTAINLFVRDFPRLSVDIDLVFLLGATRAEHLAAIGPALDGWRMRFQRLCPVSRLSAHSCMIFRRSGRCAVARMALRIAVSVSGMGATPCSCCPVAPNPPLS